MIENMGRTGKEFDAVYDTLFKWMQRKAAFFNDKKIQL